MKKTTYFSDSVQQWLADHAQLEKGCPDYDKENERVELHIATCRLDKNSRGCVVRLAVKAEEAKHASYFLFTTADDVRSIAELADTISAL